jgi:hypothetical protein
MKKQIQWEFSVGFYEGLLFGLRSYEQETHIDYVFYIPFVDICITIYNN